MVQNITNLLIIIVYVFDVILSDAGRLQLKLKYNLHYLFSTKKNNNLKSEQKIIE